ncbi:MAG: hypothetical protein JWO32_576 [Bacteroidetes bacterium]|nr:hypothetical protein [Bacteroidota bacterium]
MNRFIFIFLLTFIYFCGKSQCCGGCNPIGGNTNQGTLPKYMLQVNSYFRNATSQGYFEKDHPSDFKFVKNGNSNFIGLQVGYGITKRFTADIETGYYLNRTQNFEIYGSSFRLNGYGGSAVTLTGKYNFIKDTVHDFEFTAGIGVKVPWGIKPMVVNGVELSEDVQPSNGAFGIALRSFLFKEFDHGDVKIFLMNTLTFNGTNPKEYKEGNTYISALFLSKRLIKNLTGICQVRNELRERAYRQNTPVTSSGGIRFVFIPQLNYSIKQKFNFSVLYELPFYQNYNGIQLRDKNAFSINLNIRLGLNKNVNQLCEKPR